MLKFAINVVSAIFGLFGTWMMSRRYAKEFGRSVVYAFVAPILLLCGRGDRVRKFIKNKVKGNLDLPDSAGDMALGLNLLFWAFLLQLAALVLEQFKLG